MYSLSAIQGQPAWHSSISKRNSLNWDAQEKCLPYKREFKSPKIILKPGTTEQACNPSTVEEETGGSLRAGEIQRSQWVKCLLYKCAELSSNPQSPKSPVQEHVAWEADTRAGGPAALVCALRMRVPSLAGESKGPYARLVSLLQAQPDIHAQRPKKMEDHRAPTGHRWLGKTLTPKVCGC